MNVFIGPSQAILNCSPFYETILVLVGDLFSNAKN
jgi:hypothetical protein